MAMNKTEKAAFEKLQEDLRIARAFRFTGPAPEFDVHPPNYMQEGISRGWHHNIHTLRIGRGCSSSTGHSTWRDDKTESQGSRSFFSTKLKALQAMRVEAEMQYARELAKIDKMIEAESEAFPLANCPQSVHNYLKEIE